MPEVKHVAREGKSGKAMNLMQSCRAVWVVAMAAASVFGSTTNELVLGEVRVQPSALAISFPAQVNQRTGLVEYLMVHETGKTHESIFKTKVSAQQIHAAALLFAEKAAGGTNVLPRVRNIEVTWASDARTNRFAAAELILDREKKRALRETKWAYRGSRLVEGVFLAQRDGSLIAIMEDRDALIDQATPDASDDENWEPMTEKLPGVGAPVTVTLIFEKPPAK
jgi:hypothetical protein